MSELIEEKTYYELSLDKKILEFKNSSNNFNIGEFLENEFKKRIKFVLEYEISDFNNEVIEELKKSLNRFEYIFENYGLLEIYDEKRNFILKSLDLILKESDNYVYLGKPEEILEKKLKMKNRILMLKKEFIK